jgi:hypothetical protein
LRGNRRPFFAASPNQSCPGDRDHQDHQQRG